MLSAEPAGANFSLDGSLILFYRLLSRMSRDMIDSPPPMRLQPTSNSKRVKRRAPSRHPYEWSIGIYAGDSPFHLSPAPKARNPVLTGSDISDVPAAFVADPFMIEVDGLWHMFFEVMNSKSKKGEIGLAVSANGLNWDYRQIVLDEPCHLSYPYVFEWQGGYYMIPETQKPCTVSLYKADSFPTDWSLVGPLIEGEGADSSVFYFADRWWLFTCATPFQHDTLRLYFADDLLGPWREHPASPIIEGNHHIARPGGRVLVMNDTVVRFTQDCYPNYGIRIRAFEISELTPTKYREQEATERPILGPSGKGWNRSGMHTVDPHLTSEGRWIACVDGVSRI